MEDLFLSESDQKRQAIIETIDGNDARAIRQFTVLRDSYPGPRSDIDTAQDALVQWKSIRDETIRLLRAGKTAEAAARQKSTGDDGKHTEALLGKIRKVDDFARDKGDQ
jgi:hypothetical protein